MSQLQDRIDRLLARQWESWSEARAREIARLETLAGALYIAEFEPFWRE